MPPCGRTRSRNGTTDLFLVFADVKQTVASCRKDEDNYRFVAAVPRRGDLALVDGRSRVRGTTRPGTPSRWRIPGGGHEE
jgi:hypothetical protein